MMESPFVFILLENGNFYVSNKISQKTEMSLFAC